MEYDTYVPTNVANLKLINSDTHEMVPFSFEAEEVAMCTMH